MMRLSSSSTTNFPGAPAQPGPGLPTVHSFRSRLGRLGTGLSFACAEAGAHVFGFDPDEEAIEVARGETPWSLRKRVRFEVADAAEIELPRRKFDLALFSWSL